MVGGSGVRPIGESSMLAGSGCARDDRVGEIEECLDDGRAPLVAAGESVEGVPPCMGAFDVPALTGLDGRLLAFVRDAAVQAAFVSSRRLRIVVAEQVVPAIAS